MDLSRIILGPIVTEKAERQKVASNRVFTLKVAQGATKVDVKNAVKHFYDVDVIRVRVMNTRPKIRIIGRDRAVQKRDPYKKVMITLAPKSKPLDLVSVQS